MLKPVLATKWCYYEAKVQGGIQPGIVLPMQGETGSWAVRLTNHGKPGLNDAFDWYEFREYHRLRLG